MREAQTQKRTLWKKELIVKDAIQKERFQDPLMDNNGVY